MKAVMVPYPKNRMRINVGNNARLSRGYIMGK
jgi:hypothetical protein